MTIKSWGTRDHRDEHFFLNPALQCKMTLCQTLSMSQLYGKFIIMSIVKVLLSLKWNLYPQEEFFFF